MKPFTAFCRSFLLYLLRLWPLWLVLALILGGSLWLRGLRDASVGTLLHTTLSVERSTAIDISPEEIRAIRRIGQFETLTIETEELAELHESGLLSDKQIARIYAGTLRIGVDLSLAADDWFTARGDTALLVLPRVRLLQQDFIDETLTRPFYESGTWNAEARERLYKQARQKMMRRELTPQHFAAARQGAVKTFSRMFFALGFKYVIINWE